MSSHGSICREDNRLKEAGVMAQVVLMKRRDMSDWGRRVFPPISNWQCLGMTSDMKGPGGGPETKAGARLPLLESSLEGVCADASSPKWQLHIMSP